MDGVMFQLNVNDDIVTTVYNGDVLMFTATITYPDAVENRYYNESIDEKISELKERYEAGDISEEEYKNEVDKLEKEKMDIKKIKIGVKGKPWVENIQFLIKNGEDWQPLNWEIVVLNYSPDGEVIELTGDELLYAELAIDPEYIVKEIPEGEYVVKARISDIESNMVGIKIIHSESKENVEDRLGKTARYYILRGNLDKARSLIDGILSVNPSSIMGLILLAQLFESMEEYDKALEALEKARKEFIAQNPDFWEPPRYIDTKITRLLIKKTMKEGGKLED